MNELLLKITGLEKRYPTRWGGPVAALRGVDLKLCAGDFVALRGVSGCGKTTLLLCAGTLLRPDGGEVLIDGHNPYDRSAADRSAFRAANIGFVFQNFHLVPYLSVLDNVLLVALAGGRSAALEQWARELLDQFQLGHRLRHRPAELSIGEQQRVALARAVASGARLILADEPTGNLDAKNSQIMLEQLAVLAAGGAAVLMVTHDPAASDRAHRCLDMRDGRLCTATNESDAN
jgi:ABC-type lipoprotein export system ATPase subunit